MVDPTIERAFRQHAPILEIKRRETGFGEQLTRRGADRRATIAMRPCSSNATPVSG